MKRIRIAKPKVRREQHWHEPLPLDPRDLDIVRATRVRATAAGAPSPGTRHQGRSLEVPTPHDAGSAVRGQVLVHDALNRRAPRERHDQMPAGLLVQRARRTPHLGTHGQARSGHYRQMLREAPSTTVLQPRTPCHVPVTAGRVRQPEIYARQAAAGAFPRRAPPSYENRQTLAT